MMRRMNFCLKGKKTITTMDSQLQEAARIRKPKEAGSQGQRRSLRFKIAIELFYSKYQLNLNVKSREKNGIFSSFLRKLF